MRYLSVCSGIEAATVAWHPLGWTPVAFSEIEPFPAAVLAHHYPDVPNYRDMTKHKEWPLEPGSIDLLVGGTPCQSFSVAGLRKGISDPRGGLMLTYLEIAQRLRPRWIVWENVPGVLSSGGGRDFGSFLGALGELGYGWAYRVLDAQWVRTQRHPRAVPQRRRRVFVVGCLGDGERAAQVLFERESVQRDFAKGREAREDVAGTLAARSGECRNNHEQLITSHEVAPCLETTCHDYSRADGFTMVGQPSWPAEVAPTLNQSNRGTGALGYSDQELFLQGAGNLVPQPVAIQGNLIGRDEGGPQGVGASGDGAMYTLTKADVHGVAQPVPYDLFQITAPVNRQNRKPGDLCHTLARDNAAHAAVAFTPGNLARGAGPSPNAEVAPTQKCSAGRGADDQRTCVAIVGTDLYNGAITGDVAATMGTPGSSVNASGPTVMQAHAMTVRRLTPRECERLQAFPDDYTLIPWRKKPAADCPDGPRYKALGNSMAVNVVTWIGERIQAIDAQTRLQPAPTLDNGGGCDVAAPL